MREIAAEKAEGFVRTERRLLAALEAYRTHERHTGIGERAVWDLVEAVTALVVQREACGLRDAQQLLQFYAVPREVVARIGIRRPPSDITSANRSFQPRR